MLPIDQCRQLSLGQWGARSTVTVVKLLRDRTEHIWETNNEDVISGHTCPFMWIWCKFHNKGIMCVRTDMKSWFLIRCPQLTHHFTNVMQDVLINYSFMAVWLIVKVFFQSVKSLKFEFVLTIMNSQKEVICIHFFIKSQYSFSILKTIFNTENYVLIKKKLFWMIVRNASLILGSIC